MLCYVMLYAMLLYQLIVQIELSDLDKIRNNNKTSNGSLNGTGK